MNAIERIRAQERMTKRFIYSLKQRYLINEFDKYFVHDFFDLKGLWEIQNVLESFTRDLKDQKDMDEIKGYCDVQLAVIITPKRSKGCNTIEQTRAQERTTKRFSIYSLNQRYLINEFDKYFVHTFFDLKGLQEIQNVLESFTRDLKDQKDMDEIKGYCDFQLTVIITPKRSKG